MYNTGSDHTCLFMCWLVASSAMLAVCVVDVVISSCMACHIVYRMFEELKRVNREYGEWQAVVKEVRNRGWHGMAWHGMAWHDAAACVGVLIARDANLSSELCGADHRVRTLHMHVSQARRSYYFLHDLSMR